MANAFYKMNNVTWDVSFYQAANYTRPTICDMRHVQHWTWSRWFEYYEHLLAPIVETCFKNLHEDPVCWATPRLDIDTPLPDCPGAYQMISCVQTYIPQQVSLAMQGAQVILGLTPALISSLSASVGEISMLSANRPVLCFLLVMASPGLWSPRLLEYDDPLAVLEPIKTKTFLHGPRKHVGAREKAISACQYILVLIAGFSTFGVSWCLGYLSIPSWKVGCPELVFLWSCAVIVPHLLTAIPWYFSRVMKAERADNRAARQEENDRHGILWAMFIRETTICVAKRRRAYREHKLLVGDEPWWVLWSNVVAGWLGWVLVLYGTCLFSSLLWISPINALACILAYVGSTIICRMIITYELQGMRAVEFFAVEQERDDKANFHEQMAADCFAHADLKSVVSPTPTVFETG